MILAKSLLLSGPQFPQITSQSILLAQKLQDSEMHGLFKSIVDHGTAGHLTPNSAQQVSETGGAGM